MIDVKSFAATGNGTTDDTTAIQNALNAVPAGGGKVFFPKGVYRVTAALNLPDKPVWLQGEGMQVSIVRWTTSSNGFVGSYSQFYVNMPTTISDLTLATAVPSTGAAISLDFPDAPSVNEPTVRIFNVSIRPDPSTGNNIAWNTGISLNDCWNAHLSDVFIHGANNDRTKMAYGILLNNKTNDVVIDRAKVFGADRAVYITGQCEGTVLGHCTLVGLNYGVVFDTAAQRPWGAVNDSHINAHIRGILVQNHPQVTISGNLIYKDGASTSDFRGIHITNSSGGARVTGNQVVINFGSTGNREGIVVDGASSYCTLLGNIAVDATYAVIVAADVTRCVINSTVRQQISFSGVQTVLNNGSNNIVTNRNPAP